MNKIFNNLNLLERNNLQNLDIGLIITTKFLN